MGDRRRQPAPPRSLAPRFLTATPFAPITHASVTVTPFARTTVADSSGLIDPPAFDNPQRATQVNPAIESPAITIPTLHHAPAIGPKGRLAPVFHAPIPCFTTLD